MSKYLCRLSVLALLILIGFAALPASERMAYMQSDSQELPQLCVI